MSLYQSITQKGLYDSKNEHDACGIGFYANMVNRRSYNIVQKSLEILERLDHRGGIGSEGVTADGARIMTEIPHDLLNEEHPELSAFGEYSVGMYLIDADASIESFKEIVKNTVDEEGHGLMAFREVPDNVDAIASHVQQTMPQFIQV